MPLVRLGAVHLATILLASAAIAVVFLADLDVEVFFLVMAACMVLVGVPFVVLAQRWAAALSPRHSDSRRAVTWLFRAIGVTVLIPAAGFVLLWLVF